MPCAGNLGKAWPGEHHRAKPFMRKKNKMPLTNLSGLARAVQARVHSVLYAKGWFRFPIFFLISGFIFFGFH
jgi:hypothetical protein